MIAVKSVGVGRPDKKADDKLLMRTLNYLIRLGARQIRPDKKATLILR